MMALANTLSKVASFSTVSHESHMTGDKKNGYVVISKTNNEAIYFVWQRTFLVKVFLCFILSNGY